MRSGYAPTTAGVPVGTVTVDGVAREVTGVSTVRELGGGGVPGVSASAAAEGSVEFGQLKNSDSQPAFSPWTRTGNWPPAPGSVVQVDAGSQLESFRMLTGVVDSSSAGSDGFISSSLIDPVDRLHRRINMISYLHSTPPRLEGDPPRNVGVSSDWVADIVLRRCAYFTTPYMAAGMSGVNVPGTGSMLPERGVVETAGRYGQMSLAAQFLGSTFGWGIYSADATYTPEGTITAASGFTMATLIGARHEAQASVEATEGAGKWILAVQSNQALNLYYNGGLVASLPPGPSRRVEARVAAGSVALVTDDGRQATGTHPAGSGVTTAPVSSVRITAQAGANISGVMVANMPNGHFLNYPLNARIVGGTSLGHPLLSSPRIDNRDALDVLTEIAKATCRAFWWDEDGVFQWHPGDVLLGRNPVHTLTSLDSLVDLGWSESLADTYRAVTVSHDVPTVTMSRRPNVPVWQGAGQSLDSQQEAFEIASPSADEDWIQPQWSPMDASSSTPFLNEMNHGRRSWWGGVVSDGTLTAWANYGTELTVSFQPVGNVAMKYTYKAGVIPANKSVQLTFPNDASTTAVWSRWRNEKLPIIRAYGRVDWLTASVSASGGPAGGGDYSHDGGRWLQGISGETPGAIAAFLATYLCTPHPKLNRVEIQHDPRVQIGDVVTVRDEHAHGVELRALVTRVEQSTGAGGAQMFLDLFVISGKPAFVTISQHDAANAGKTLGQHDASQAGKTVSAHDSNPLHTA